MKDHNSLDSASSSIRKVDMNEARILSEIGSKTFVESHGHSANTDDINAYLLEALSPSKVKADLADPENLFYFIELGGQAVGYSKLLLNRSFSNNQSTDYCKLERIYLVEEFHGRGLGLRLLEFNIELAKKKSQQGMWLHVWVENQRAVDFYTRYGFEIAGKYDFRLSANHVNPNHQMLLTW